MVIMNSGLFGFEMHMPNRSTGIADNSDYVYFAGYIGSVVQSSSSMSAIVQGQITSPKNINVSYIIFICMVSG